MSYQKNDRITNYFLKSNHKNMENFYLLQIYQKFYLLYDNKMF
jgi:hypothetical protein